MIVANPLILGKKNPRLLADKREPYCVKFAWSEFVAVPTIFSASVV